MAASLSNRRMSLAPRGRYVEISARSRAQLNAALHFGTPEAARRRQAFPDMPAAGIGGSPPPPPGNTGGYGTLMPTDSSCRLTTASMVKAMKSGGNSTGREFLRSLKSEKVRQEDAKR